jgi:AcrR family transcriptional regulator
LLVTGQAESADWSTVLGTAVLAGVDATAQRRGAKLRPTEQMAERLGAAAIRLFSERGFDQVTVADVAAVAGVTRRTFFRYYPTKETVVIDIADRTSDRLTQLIRTVRPGAGAIEVVREALVQWFAEYDELFRAISRLTAASPSLQSALLLRSAVWEEHLAEALRIRYPDLDRSDARVWGATSYALLRLAESLATSRGTALDGAAREVVDRFARLIAAER